MTNSISSTIAALLIFATRILKQQGIRFGNAQWLNRSGMKFGSRLTIKIKT